MSGEKQYHQPRTTNHARYKTSHPRSNRAQQRRRKEPELEHKSAARTQEQYRRNVQVTQRITHPPRGTRRQRIRAACTRAPRASPRALRKQQSANDSVRDEKTLKQASKARVLVARNAYGSRATHGGRRSTAETESSYQRSRCAPCADRPARSPEAASTAGGQGSPEPAAFKATRQPTVSCAGRVKMTSQRK